MKRKQLILNLAVAVLVLLILAAVVLGYHLNAGPVHTQVSDRVEQIDLDTIYLKSSGVEVNFSDVILSSHEPTRKLIVSTQTGTVSTTLTKRLIEQLDFDFMKKTQSVSYTGTGYFVVDLGSKKLTAADVTEDRDKHTVTIQIGHAELEAIDIDPNKIIIDAVKEGLFARGDIKLTVADYKAIERDLRTRLEKKLDTAANGQAADDIALKMVREVYEPIVKAVDPRCSVIVQFKE